MTWNDPMSMTMSDPLTTGWGMTPYQQQGGALVDPNQTAAAREIRRDLIRPYYVRTVTIDTELILLIASLSHSMSSPSRFTLLFTPFFSQPLLRADLIEGAADFHV
jgi:hypothetical protein